MTRPTAYEEQPGEFAWRAIENGIERMPEDVKSRIMQKVGPFRGSFQMHEAGDWLAKVAEECVNEVAKAIADLDSKREKSGD